MLVLLFVALWFILRGDLFYVLPCVVLFLRFSVLLALRLPRLGKRELFLVLFVFLFDLCLFGVVDFLFLLVSGKSCGLWFWHSLDLSLAFFYWNKQSKNTPGLLLLIDFEKAFDSLSWPFIQKALKFLNFDYSSRRWIQTFYSNITSAVIQCGYLSVWVLISIFSIKKR